jgi:predicted nucleic acid-binding protein
MTSPEFGELLLDASVFIAAEAGRPLSRRPSGQARVSVVTLAELRLGVLRSEGALRQVREATLSAARRFIPLAVTEPVADELAGLLAKLRASDRRAKAFDCFVAATALAHALVVVTQDNDFEALRAAEPRLAVQLV